MAATTADFRFEYAQSAGIGGADSRLEIDGDQATWYHEPPVAVIERGVIGVFRTQVSAAERQALAAAMPAGSTPGLRPGMPAQTARLKSAGQERVVALAPTDPAADRLKAEARKIIERARSRPYRALRIDLVQVEPPRVRIENVGSEPLVLPLDEQSLFVESSPTSPVEWQRAGARSWRRTFTIAPGGHADVDLPAVLPAARPRWVRAMFQRPAADSLEDVGGTASSRHVRLDAAR
ncbi:hypothetical protein HLB44_26695 [Aquincola sp. S2]|uniref:Uncharacterized protein n=1 Tax=Pseudaquabacterium terrae TaxID=2732868 RepID=A0ABX2EPQ5_9BURK|nr:hypothetical protein [Aquabacterium terrae]NRF70598.1 hypothetical protein [Aquabacterium terrae]